MSMDLPGVEELRAIGGRKWSAYGDALGAFIAEMDFGIAPEIKRTLHEAVDLGRSGYLTEGMDRELHRAVSGFLERRYGWEVPVERVVTQPDVLCGLVLLLRRFLPAYARVVVPTPAYMPFLTLPQANGHELIEVPMLRDDLGWHLDLAAIERTLRPGDLFVLCNPHNPIGKTYARDELLALSEVIDRCGARVFNDEIHAPLVFREGGHVPYPTVSPAADRHSLTAMSASKAWNLAGYKCAQLIVNEQDLPIVKQYEADLDGASTPGVLANTTAFTEGEEWLAEVLGYLHDNQRHLTLLLDELLPEVRFLPNQGTYLAWLDCERLAIAGSPSEFFLREAGVATTDGAACGTGFSRCVRFNYATPRPLLEEMLRRMSRALG